MNLMSWDKVEVKSLAYFAKYYQLENFLWAGLKYLVLLLLGFFLTSYHQMPILTEAAKISALSSGKTDRFEFLTGEEILPSGQSRIIKQAKFIYSPLSKAFEKQVKTIEDQGRKQDVAKEMRTNETKNKVNEIKKWEEKSK